MIISASILQYNTSDIKRALDTKISEFSDSGVYDYLTYPTYTVQSPYTSGPFWINDKIVIKWNYTEELSDLIPSTSISIYDNSGWEKEIYTNIKTSDKNVLWLIPQSLDFKLDTDYYIKVYSYVDDIKIEDSSTSFKIDKRYLTVTSQVPTKPIVANAGNTLDISWIGNGLSEYYKIEMLRVSDEGGAEGTIITTVIDDKYYTTGNSYTWNIENISPDIIVDNLNTQEVVIKITDLQNNISGMTQKISLLVPYIKFMGTIGRLITDASAVDDVIIGVGPGNAEISLYAFDPKDFRVRYNGSFTFNYDTVEATEVYLTKESNRVYYETLPRLSGVHRIENIIENEKYNVNVRDAQNLIKSAPINIVVIPRDGDIDPDPILLTKMTNLQFLQYCISLGEESLTSGDAIIEPLSKLPTLIPQYKKEANEMDEFTSCSIVRYLLDSVIQTVIIPLVVGVPPTLLGDSELKTKIVEANDEYRRRISGDFCGAEMSVSPSTLQFTGVLINTDSNVAQYKVHGVSLVSNIEITSTQGVKISAYPDREFGDSLTIPRNLVNGNDVVVYVKINTPVSLYDSKIIHKSTGAQDKTVSIVAEILTSQIKTDVDEIDFGTSTINTPAYGQYDVWADTISGDLTIYTPLDYQISLDSVAYSNSILLYKTIDGKIPRTTIHVRFISSGIGQSINKIEHHVGYGTTNSQKDVTVKGNAIGNPEDSVITVIPESINFTHEVNIGGKIEQYYKVKSNYIEGDLNIEVPSPFSLRVPPNPTFSNNIKLIRNPYGAISDTDVILKFAPTESGSYAEIITHKIGSNAESEKDLPVSGFSVGNGNVIINPKNFNLGKINIEGESISGSYYITSPVAIANDVEIHASENTLIAEYPFTNRVKSIFIQRDANGKIGQPNGKQIHVWLKPPTVGFYSELITHHFFGNPSSFDDIIVTGEGVNAGATATVTVNPTELDFGDVPLNVSPVKSYTLSMSNDVIRVSIGTVPDIYSSNGQVSIVYNFKFSESPTGPFVENLIVQNVNNTDKTIYVQFDPTRIISYEKDALHTFSMANSNGSTILKLKGNCNSPI